MLAFCSGGLGKRISLKLEKIFLEIQLFLQIKFLDFVKILFVKSCLYPLKSQ